jgi:hypothetical protein
MHEAVAILVSVTAVLFFGEIIPQSVCSKWAGEGGGGGRVEWGDGQERGRGGGRKWF